MALLRRREDRPARRGTPADLLVVGLGNPGKEYERSRHNVGAEVVKRLAAAHGGTLKAGKERALVAEVRIAGQLVALAFPTTYMNLSGESVVRLVRRYGIEEPPQIVIVQDELDLPPGTVRVKLGGGLAGHNGLRSIAQHLKTQDFARVRIGVGKPSSKEHGANHVLDRIPKAERELIDESVVRATEAVEVIATRGIDAAMQDYNRT
ncbi:MAG: aminoacyl-tRNA hydrolase [Acidimicrobiia bacterium]